MDLFGSSKAPKTVEEIIKNELSDTSSIKYEVEARLGRIMNRESSTRIYLNSLTPIVFRKLPRKYLFVPGVDKWDVKPMQKNYENLPVEHLKDCFKYLSDGNRIRFVNGRLIYCEKKKKIKVLDIYFPEMKYDIRISVMTEERQGGRLSNAKVNLVRNRERTSYNDGVFNYDFTTVSSQDSVTYEVEIEVDDPNYSTDSFIEKFCKINILRKL